MWPNSGHSTTVNVWERIGEKHLATSYIACGREVHQPDIFTDVAGDVN